MTTTEAMQLEADFRERHAIAQREGDQRAEYLWELAADLVRAAEAASITASFNRSRKRRRCQSPPVEVTEGKQARRAKSLGLGLTR